jgi:hypothetical protein
MCNDVSPKNKSDKKMKMHALLTQKRKRSSKRQRMEMVERLFPTAPAAA